MAAERLADLTDDQRSRLEDLACLLSPENLHCDGELSAEGARRKRERIRAEWAKIEAEAGRAISVSEVESALLERLRARSQTR